MKKNFKFVFLSLFVIFIFACNSTKVEQKKAILYRYPDAMLWRIDGFDKRGKSSTVYCLGTIHYGDDRLYPWPECIDEAFNSAKRYYGELSEEDIAALPKEVMTMLMKSGLSLMTNNKNQKPLPEGLTKEEIGYIEKTIPNIKNYYRFEPWVLNTVLSQYGNSGLYFNKGYDSYIMQELQKRKVKYLGMDILQDQLDVICFGSWNFQLQNLKNSLQEIMHPEKQEITMTDLYNAYLAADENKVLEILNQAYETSNPELKEEYKDYIELILNKRNQKWAEKIPELLYAGGTTFIYAGCAHFIGEASAFEYMRKNGTLE
ncbi:MAG: TraB/GumN family protein [Treponema sp.]|nr:TraB/GumN family protein [Treponema sp.]